MPRLPLTVDIADESDVVALELAAFGPIDIEVNKAGDDRVPVLQFVVELWRRTINLNLTDGYVMSRHFGEAVLRHVRATSTVTISSLIGKTLPGNPGPYTSPKAGVPVHSGEQHVLAGARAISY